MGEGIPAGSFHPPERTSGKSVQEILDLPAGSQPVLSSGIRAELVIPTGITLVPWPCSSLLPGAALGPFLAALPGSWRVPSGSSRSAGRGPERSRGVWNIPDPPGVTAAGRGREQLLSRPVPACWAKFGRRAERRDEQVGEEPWVLLWRLRPALFSGSYLGFPSVFPPPSPAPSRWLQWELSSCQGVSFQGFVPQPEPSPPGRGLARGRFIPGITRGRVQAGVEQLQVPKSSCSERGHFLFPVEQFLMFPSLPHGIPSYSPGVCPIPGPAPQGKASPSWFAGGAPLALCCWSWFLISLGAGLGWGWDGLQAGDGVGMGSVAPARFPEGIPAPGEVGGQGWTCPGAAEHSCLENLTVGDFLAFQGSPGASSQLPFLTEPHPWGLIPKEGIVLLLPGISGPFRGRNS